MIFFLKNLLVTDIILLLIKSTLLPQLVGGVFLILVFILEIHIERKNILFQIERIKNYNDNEELKELNDDISLFEEKFIINLILFIYIFIQILIIFIFLIISYNFFDFNTFFFTIKKSIFDVSS